MGMANKGETLDWLYRLKSEIFVFMPKDWLIPFADALDVAIKALEQEPTTKNDLGVDCIDRAKAQTEIEMNAFRYTLAKERGGTGEVEWNSHLISIDDEVDIIRNLPSVTPQEPCEDVISRKSIKQKLQEHHDFFVNAYGGFSNLPQNDKSRVDEIINCIAMVVNEPPVTPQEPKIKERINSAWECGYDVGRGEQKSILNKIRAEIMDCLKALDDVEKFNIYLPNEMSGRRLTYKQCLGFIDKYKAEVEPQESGDKE